MKKICIIPARMGSSRFPGKPLKTALGIPLIIHVAKRCLLSNSLDYVAVATCDQEIKEVCDLHNINVIMTSHTHDRCTDRVSEAILKLPFTVTENDFIIMVQGDEILVNPEMLDKMISAYIETPFPVINLLSTIYQKEDLIDPNVVKVVKSLHDEALYFSRAPLPSDFRNNRFDEIQRPYQQMGIIGFSKDFLRQFSALPQTPLEKIESIDMLRVLEHGLKIKVIVTDQETVAVDTESDLTRAEQILETDPLIKQYL
jgi:3-deoxy-manno-octulosonate cytidylyltransferase (CMP-KDO synthetase)